MLTTHDHALADFPFHAQHEASPYGLTKGSGSTSGVSSRDSAAEGSETDSKESAVVATDKPAVLHFAIPCYTCKKSFRELHEFYDRLCPVCAKLNFLKRNQVADLRGKVCLVTGARVKIGYRCCLKLLRCGASVIATTRFPVVRIPCNTVGKLSSSFSVCRNLVPKT